jgi:hypothetical protein
MQDYRFTKQIMNHSLIGKNDQNTLMKKLLDNINFEAKMGNDGDDGILKVSLLLLITMSIFFFTAQTFSDGNERKGT